MDPALAIELSAMSRQRAINEAIDKGESDIQQFYAGATVFVTGGSGFLGKQLVEKLFRSCKVKKIYLLLRPKKGKTVQERLAEILKDPVYDGLRKKQSNFEDKMAPVEGDNRELRVGISDQDWKILTEEVTVIFHGAATTRFDESIRSATLTNVRGTREVLALGKACKRLRAFVHISTAFSGATRSRIKKDIFEKFYPSPMSPNALIEMVETMSEQALNDATPQLLQDWPNTYCLTKAVAEELVRAAEGLPACVVRPAVVIGAYREPAPGWIDASCAYGPSGLILGTGLGVLHTVLGDQNNRMDLVPADLVNNAVLAAAWDTATGSRGEQPRIYTVSSSRNFTRWSDVASVYRKDGAKIHTPRAIWYCFAADTSNRLLFTLLFWLLHYIPAYVIDAVCVLCGKRPKFVKLYTKAYKLIAVFAYFTTNEWYFDDCNLQKLDKRLSETDREMFNFDAATIDWKEMILVWCMGLRKYVIKDGLIGTDRAVKKQYLFCIANYILLTLYAYALWKLLSLMFSVFTYVLLIF